MIGPEVARGGARVSAGMPPAIPRGIEVLLRKAAVDRGLRAKLLKAPLSVADSIGLPLEAAEAGTARASPRSASLAGR